MRLNQLGLRQEVFKSDDNSIFAGRRRLVKHETPKMR